MAFQMGPRPKTAGRNCSRAFFFVAMERQFCHSRVVTFVPHTSEPFTRHGHPSHTVTVILVIVVGTVRLIGSNANNVFSQVGSSLQ